jgi:hypothetical protein
MTTSAAGLIEASLLSLFAGADHPLAGRVLAAVRQFEKDDYICGPTDFAQHPVYQTRWLKFGRRQFRPHTGTPQKP